MKKIMFNDRYGLTQAVLEGRKTQTRRIARIEDIVPNITCYPRTYPHAHYLVGEEVAIAQSYNDIYMEKNAPCPIPEEYRLNAFDKGFNRGHKGWHNKMYVSADDMPFRIKITNIRVERLQDISEEDCLKEGIDEDKRYSFGNPNDHFSYDTPRESFAALIDKTCGRGTWHSNPWVFVYDFELVK